MNATLDDLPLLSRLLDDMAALAPGQLRDWLDALPPEHARLRPALQAMAALQDAPDHAAFRDGFLQHGPQLHAADAADGSEARPGDDVGPYRLVREIGRGGMGTVWQAERIDGQLRRTVALKLPRGTWGMRLAERMARERDIGARLEHPHIARLYDAGIDARGRPYLAHEFVDGVPLDRWCRERRLGVPERLRLGVQVARALAHAHGRLVVHRDLKPSNVLVTPDGQVRLLDFGIAKLLADEDDAAEPLTRERERLLTPRYASPEQLRGERVTVASDVYALGVLLYELLTGRLPHEPAYGGLAALERAVLEDEPVPASRRAADARTARALRGALDAVLAKALRRDPDARYASADAMAEDLERHLRGDAVLARPDGLGERLLRRLRRHRVAFAASALVVVALAGGTAAALMQARRAEETAARARAVQDFLVDMFQLDAHGESTNAVLRQMSAEPLLERGARLVEGRYAGQPALQAEIDGVLGGLLAGLGNAASAAPFALRQLERQVGAGGASPAQAQAALLLARTLLAQDRAAEAATMAAEALALAGADAALQPRIQLLRAQALLRLGDAQAGQAALAAAQRAPGQPPSADAARARALGAALAFGRGEVDPARAQADEAVQEALAAEGALSPAAVDIRLSVAHALERNRRFAEADAMRTAALDTLRASGVVGEVRAALEAAAADAEAFRQGRLDHDAARAAHASRLARLDALGAAVPARARAQLDLAQGRIELDWGAVSRADALVAGAMAVLAREPAGRVEREDRADLLGDVAMAAGRHDEAEAHFAQHAALQALPGAGHEADRVGDRLRRALNRTQQGRADDARVHVEAAASYAAAARDRTRVAWARVRIALEQGDVAAASASMPDGGADDAADDDAQTRLLRGELRCAQGRAGDGLAIIEQVVRDTEGRISPDAPQLARARSVAGLCALTAGQRARAAELAGQARAALRAEPGASAFYRRPLERLEARLAARAAAD